jgi:hypothetical protein
MFPMKPGIVMIQGRVDKKNVDKWCSQLEGQEQVHLIFDSDGGGCHFVQQMVEVINKISLTTAMITQAHSAAATIALHCNERLLIKNGGMSLHAGCFPYLELNECRNGCIPKDIFQKVINHERLLLNRLDELGFKDESLLNRLHINGWLEGDPKDWADRGLVELI